MIATELYDGQGLGNQLWAYAVTRMIAEKNGYDFAIYRPERFKGKNFIELDFGRHDTPEVLTIYKEKENIVNGHSMWPYDPDMEKVPDNTMLQGNFQSYQYLRRNEDKVRSWFKFKVKSDLENNYCLVHFRAGDYLGIPNVFLPRSYYQQAMKYMQDINPHMKFLAVSDMPDLAREFLGIETIGGIGEDPHKASHHYGGDVGVDFSLLMNAKYLIIPNSSFSWWAAFLNTRKEVVVAPEFWAGWKRGEWQTSDIKSDGFTYVKPA